jgi:hypothetical protein
MYSLSPSIFHVGPTFVGSKIDLTGSIPVTTWEDTTFRMEVERLSR